MRFKPLQDALFSCPYLVIEDVQYELVDWQALWVMNCLHSTATVILKVNRRVKTVSFMDWYLPNCGNEWLLSASHFTDLLSVLNGFVESHSSTSCNKITSVHKPFDPTGIKSRKYIHTYSNLYFFLFHRKWEHAILEHSILKCCITE